MTTFGTIAGSAARTQKFIQSADPVDLTTQINTYLIALFASDVPPAVASITLAGAGDGHTFVVTIESAAPGSVNGGFVQLRGGPGVLVLCYLAGEAEALANARAALATALFDSPIADEQLAGAAKGTRFMGMVVAGTPRLQTAPPS